MTNTAAIIGTGVIGAGWAARFLLNGWNVNIFDPDPNAARTLNATLTNARYALPMLYDTALPTEGTLTVCPTISAAVKNATWIQESVPERLALKRKTFQTIQEHCPPEAIIASSTSGFKPSDLQSGATRPEQILVAHPFNPVYLLPLIELVPSGKNPPQLIENAKQTLTSLGFFPLHVRAEIDAHVADRFLEAVWREALWLIKDDIATTEEIDNAIRTGFGLRWAQMGLFETYRIAGGEGSMRHFIEQFGPCLQSPWTKLMDVPELTDELITKITEQSDAQSGHQTIRELERSRDENLIAILRALKARDAGAGTHLLHHEAALAPVPAKTGPLITVHRTIPIDWTDYNGHMNESRYGQVFSDAADVVMAMIGADADYIAAGHSFFTVEVNIKFQMECRASDAIQVASSVTEGTGKKLRLLHEMRATDGTVLATADQLLLHVSLATRRTSPMPADMAAKAAALMKDTP